jgi:hypothetical protein
MARRAAVRSRFTGEGQKGSKMKSQTAIHSLLQGVLIVAAVTYSLAACGKALDGKYTDPRGWLTYAFNSSGKVRISGAGPLASPETEPRYEVEGSEVKISTGQGVGRLIMKIQPDGCLDAGDFKLCRTSFSTAARLRKGSSSPHAKGGTHEA